MKTTIFFLIIFLMISSLSAQVIPASDALKKNENPERFYSTDEEIRNLKNELKALKQEILMYRSDVNMPKIREEIREMITIPELSHNIILKNGTIVQGNIIEENLEIIQVRTLIGIITLQQQQIKSIEKIKKQEPLLEFDGPVKEMTYEDKKVFTGNVKNSGTQRADYVRVVFLLYDDSANLIQADSSFILGNNMKYHGGIYSSSSLMPEQSGTFQCNVPTLGKNVSYYTSEIKYTEIE
jgi:hypothetical protein